MAKHAYAIAHIKAELLIALLGVVSLGQASKIQVPADHSS
jgi:hypothetical protein